jgi:hypothetical protein
VGPREFWRKFWKAYRIERMADGNHRLDEFLGGDRS